MLYPNLSIDWFITTKCNDFCKFCYAPMNFKEYNLTLENYLQICNRIRELGFTKVTICGGEPTLNNYIVEIVNYLFSIGLKVIFYTNGIKSEIIKQIANKIDFLSLPIDCIHNETQNLRSKVQIVKVFETLNQIENLTDDKIKVKIGTVVNKLNINSLDEIYYKIKKYNVIKHWRLYQFSSAEKALKYKDMYDIDNECFEVVVEKYKKLSNSDFNISSRSKRDNIGYCIIMDQIGNIYRYEEKYIDLQKNIFNSTLEDIISEYDLNKNILQKSWSIA